MFKVSLASLQTFIDTQIFFLKDRVRYSAVYIPNVFCDGYLRSSVVWGLFEYTEYCNNQVHRDILITLYKEQIVAVGIFDIHLA
jgi:hypothetical protein